MRGLTVTLIVLLFSTASAANRIVNYIEEVDAVQANLEGLDIYEKLTTLNDSIAEIDTLHSRVDSLGSEVDTLRLRCDTLAVDIDTLYLQGDTLHVRIDSLMTRDTVFFAYDNNGFFTLGMGTTTPIPLDTEIRKDAIYGHDSDKDAVAVSTAGWYKISYAFSVKPGATGDVRFNGHLQRYNSGWTSIAGATQFAKAGDDLLHYGSVSTSVLVELSAGDSVRIRGCNYSASVNLATMPYSTNLMIEKIQ